MPTYVILYFRKISKYGVDALLIKRVHIEIRVARYNNVRGCTYNKVKLSLLLCTYNYRDCYNCVYMKVSLSVHMLFCTTICVKPRITFLIWRYSDNYEDLTTELRNLIQNFHTKWMILNRLNCFCLSNVSWNALAIVNPRTWRHAIKYPKLFK